MSDSDILSKADRVLRPVLKELGGFPWIRLEGCCAGHKPEDSLWLEINVLGSSGLRRLTELLRILDSKLADTDCRLDCLVRYSAPADVAPVPHGWISTAGGVVLQSRAHGGRPPTLISYEPFFFHYERFNTAGRSNNLRSVVYIFPTCAF